MSTISIPVRYRVVGLLLAGTAINYLDRVNISVAATAMMSGTGLQKDSLGLVFSAFLLGYAVMQIPAGVIADRRSAKRLLALAFCAISILTALTPLAAHTFVSLILVRFLLGACEAVMFPGATAFNVRWFPPAEFARAQMLSASGAPIGQMIAYPLVAWIVLQASWQVAFYVSALLGIIWLCFWLWYSRDYPRDHPSITGKELSLLDRQVPPETESNRPLLKLLTTAPVLVLSASAMCFAFVLWTFLFWLPTYLAEARGLSLGSIGAFGVGIQVCGALGLIASGAVSDFILRTTQKAHLARPKFSGVCLLLAVMFLTGAVTVASTPTSLVLLSAFYFFFMCTPVAYHATPASLLPSQAASIYGVINTCASLGGVLGPAIVGSLVTHATGWERSLVIVAGVGLVASMLLFAVPVRRLDLTESRGGARGGSLIHS